MTEIKNKNGLSELYGKKEHSDVYIRLQIDLLSVTDKYSALAGPVGVNFPEKEAVSAKLENGFPLVSFIPMNIPPEVLAGCFRGVVSVFQSGKMCSVETAERLAGGGKKSFVRKLVKAAFSLDRGSIEHLAEEIMVEPSLLMLIGGETVKPFLRSFAGRAAGLVRFEKWTEGFCPVCGDIPCFARLSREKEGKRYLWCGKCDIEWEFPRIRCPFCENTDHKQLKFLTTSYREELRIDVCEKCRGYIRTIDERKKEHEERTVYLKEDVSSLFLDVLAEEKGYLLNPPGILKVKITFLQDHRFH